MLSVFDAIDRCVAVVDSAKVRRFNYCPARIGLCCRRSYPVLKWEGVRSSAVRGGRRRRSSFRTVAQKHDEAAFCHYSSRETTFVR